MNILYKSFHLVDVDNELTIRKDISDDFKKYYKIYKENNLKKKDLKNMSGLSRPTVDKYVKMLEENEKV